MWWLISEHHRSSHPGSELRPNCSASIFPYSISRSLLYHHGRVAGLFPPWHGKGAISCPYLEIHFQQHWTIYHPIKLYRSLENCISKSSVPTSSPLSHSAHPFLRCLHILYGCLKSWLGKWQLSTPLWLSKGQQFWMACLLTKPLSRPVQAKKILVVGFHFSCISWQITKRSFSSYCPFKKFTIMYVSKIRFTGGK